MNTKEVFKELGISTNIMRPTKNIKYKTIKVPIVIDKDVMSGDKYTKRLRKITLLIMGGRCARCGYNADSRALQIDHVNGDGYIERKKGKLSGIKLYRKVMDSYLKREGRYQLLCRNCNWLKMFDNKENRFHTPLSQD